MFGMSGVGSRMPRGAALAWSWRLPLRNATSEAAANAEIRGFLRRETGEDWAHISVAIADRENIDLGDVPAFLRDGAPPVAPAPAAAADASACDPSTRSSTSWSMPGGVLARGPEALRQTHPKRKRDGERFGV